jgi:hypothetical protein
MGLLAQTRTFKPLLLLLLLFYWTVVSLNFSGKNKIGDASHVELKFQ